MGMARPLADEIRPKTLDEIVGQRHLLAPGAVLRRLIENGADTNMVFYGPSGTGKTTIANIVAKQTQKTLYRLNATTASLQDVKDIMADVGTLMAPGGVLLYLDEIQYFNRKQQQILLEFMEHGQLTLIASTTENPYFYVYSALLSRSTVFEFKAVTPKEVEPAVLRALRVDSLGARLEVTGRMLSYGEEWILCAAGPMASLLASAAVAPLWTRSSFATLFSCASLLLGFLNLLPVSTFDGGRMLECMLLRALSAAATHRIMQYVSFLFLFLLWAMAVYFLLRAGDGLSLFAFSMSLFFHFFKVCDGK